MGSDNLFDELCGRGAEGIFSGALLLLCVQVKAGLL